MQSGWAIGWGFAVLAQAVLFSYMPPAEAWRWMFAIGALPALMVFFLRRYVEEPKIAAETLAKQKASGDRPSLGEIFSGPILKTTILASLAATGCQGGYYAITFWVPRFLTTERKLSIVGSTGYLAALIIGSFVGYLVGAWLADKIGRRNLFLTFSIGAIAVIIAYTQLPLTNEILWLLGFPLGFFASGYFSGMGAFLTELYPTRLRGSGQGFCYNFGRGIGALFPFLVGWLSTITTLGNAIAVFAVLAYAVFFIAAFALPETRGRVPARGRLIGDCECQRGPGLSGASVVSAWTYTFHGAARCRRYPCACDRHTARLSFRRAPQLHATGSNRKVISGDARRYRHDVWRAHSGQRAWRRQSGDDASTQRKPATVARDRRDPAGLS